MAPDMDTVTVTDMEPIRTDTMKMTKRKTFLHGILINFSTYFLKEKLNRHEK